MHPSMRKDCTCWMKLSPNITELMGIYSKAFPPTNPMTYVLSFQISVLFVSPPGYTYISSNVLSVLTNVCVYLCANFLNTAPFILHDIVLECICDCIHASMYLKQIAEKISHTDSIVIVHVST